MDAKTVANEASAGRVKSIENQSSRELETRPK
jgi:hypothetical protein